MRKFIFLSVLLLASPALADVRIALVGPMTGSEAAFGEQMRHGAEIAVAGINANGGLNGEKIDLDVEDDACDPKQAVNVANRIAGMGIKYVIGHWCSGTTQVASAIYAEEGILELDPAGVLPETTQKGVATMFRLSSTADYWGKMLADYAIKNGKVKKAYVLMDKRAVTEIFGKAVTDELHRADKTIEVSTDEFNGGDRDFNTIVAKIKRAGANAVFISGYTQETALIARQGQALDTNFYSWDVMGSPDFPKAVGNEALGKSIYVDYARPKNSADLVALDKELDAKGWPKETYTYMVYAAFQVLDQAWKQAPSAEVGALAKALHANTYHTLSGDVAFAANGDRASVRFSAYSWNGPNAVEIGPAN